ncbi:MAG: ComEA family DNA-binding protein [Ruminococcus sp.]
MKSILKSREMLLLILGLILTGAALIGASLARNLPNSSGVYYVSNAEKSSLIAQGEAVNPKLNINSAASEELEELDGIGEIIAQNIVSYRESHGNFSSVSELKKVEGVGDKTLDKIEPYITCE